MKIFEILFLLCFAFSWPMSIAKALRTRQVQGKSPVFMIIIMLGYVFGILNKVVNGLDYVVWFYVLNFCLVGTDLFLYYKYSRLQQR